MSTIQIGKDRDASSYSFGATGPGRITDAGSCTAIDLYTDGATVAGMRGIKGTTVNEILTPWASTGKCPVLVNDTPSFVPATAAIAAIQRHVTVGQFLAHSNITERNQLTASVRGNLLTIRQTAMVDHGQRGTECVPQLFASCIIDTQGVELDGGEDLRIRAIGGRLVRRHGRRPASRGLTGSHEATKVYFSRRILFHGHLGSVLHHEQDVCHGAAILTVVVVGRTGHANE